MEAFLSGGPLPSPALLRTYLADPATPVTEVCAPLVDGVLTACVYLLLEVPKKQFAQSPVQQQRARDATALLWSLLELVLLEHCGRGLAVYAPKKQYYLERIWELLEDCDPGCHGHAVLFHLQCARQAVLCMRDTTLLRRMVLTSLAHILTPGRLLSDIYALLFHKPALWYVKLLEANLLRLSAVTSGAALDRLQCVGGQEMSQWQLRVGLARALCGVVLEAESQVGACVCMCALPWAWVHVSLPLLRVQVTCVVAVFTPPQRCAGRPCTAAA